MQLPKGIYVSGQGVPVVLLHSSLSSAKQWQPLVAMLSPNFTVINIDLLGYGEADQVTNPASYNFSVETDRINQAIQATVGNQKYHLVGHSCGGAIALKLAVENPNQLLSLSLFEPVAFHLLPTDSAERSVAESFASRVNISDKAKSAEVFTDFWNKPGFYLSLPEKMQHKMAQDMEKVNLDFKGLISESYTLNDLNIIECPVLFMTGDKSPELSHFLAKKIEEAINNVRRTSFDDGHMAPISSYEEVQTTIFNFILNPQSDSLYCKELQ